MVGDCDRGWIKRLPGRGQGTSASGVQWCGSKGQAKLHVHTGSNTPMDGEGVSRSTSGLAGQVFWALITGKSIEFSALLQFDLRAFTAIACDYGFEPPEILHACPHYVHS